MPRASWDFIGNIASPVPLFQVQRAIADFLDRKTAAIDALIEKKERLVALLAEKRAALIHQAVTKGLDPDVPMKDSGVPWIGEIPAHWGVKQFRRLILKLDQGWSPSALDRPSDEGEWGVLKLSAVRFGRYYPNRQKTLPKDLAPRPQFMPQLKDLLIARANTPELVGDSCVVRQHVPDLMLCDLLYRVRLDGRETIPGYIDFYLRSTSGRAQRTTDARGSSHSMVKLSQSHVRGWTVPVPPLQEQTDIVEHLTASETRIRTISERAARQINKLREYRQALITAAVTGQLDIPEVIP